jgi:nitrous oxidase accessory protein NosD
MKTLVCTVAALMFGAAHAADYAISDSRALQAALAAAEPGDRIVLSPGRYGDLVIGPRFDRGPLTIDAADPEAPPQFRSIIIRESAGITLQNLSVDYGVAAKPLVEHTVEVRRSSAIWLDGVNITSAANGVALDDASGVIIRDSRDVKISNSQFNDLFRGLVVFDSDFVSVIGNRFSTIGVDGIAVRGTKDLNIEGNYFTDFRCSDVRKWHPDAIQLWSRGASRANERVVIRGNIIRRGGGGATQGIFVKSPEFASREILIEKNRIEQSMGQGILVQHGADVTIRDNVLVAIAPVLHPPGIEVRAPFERAIVANNSAPKFRLPAGVEALGNAKTP